MCVGLVDLALVIQKVNFILEKEKSLFLFVGNSGNEIIGSYISSEDEQKKCFSNFDDRSLSLRRSKRDENEN